MDVVAVSNPAAGKFGDPLDAEQIVVAATSASTATESPVHPVAVSLESRLRTFYWASSTYSAAV